MCASGLFSPQIWDDLDGKAEKCIPGRASARSNDYKRNFTFSKTWSLRWSVIRGMEALHTIKHKYKYRFCICREFMNGVEATLLDTPAMNWPLQAAENPWTELKELYWTRLPWIGRFKSASISLGSALMSSLWLYIKIVGRILKTLIRFVARSMKYNSILFSLNYWSWRCFA